MALTTLFLLSLSPKERSLYLCSLTPKKGLFFVLGQSTDVRKFRTFNSNKVSDTFVFRSGLTRQPTKYKREERRRGLLGKGLKVVESSTLPLYTHRRLYNRVNETRLLRITDCTQVLNRSSDESSRRSKDTERGPTVLNLSFGLCPVLLNGSIVW